MKLELDKKKVRLHDVMAENDGLRRGKVPFKKFRNLLQKFKVLVDENTWTMIEAQYKCNVVDFDYATLEYDLAKADVKHVSGLKSVNSDNLQIMKGYCNNSKVQLVDQFKNFDMHNKKKIKFENFTNVLIE